MEYHIFTRSVELLPKMQGMNLHEEGNVNSKPCGETSSGDISELDSVHWETPLPSNPIVMAEEGGPLNYMGNLDQGCLVGSDFVRG